MQDSSPAVLSDQQRKEIAKKTFLIILLTKGGLFILKILAGILGRSGAMLSDAANSLLDVVTTLIALYAVHFASKAQDDQHPYGHERIESVVSLFLAFVLGLTASLIGKSGIETLLAGSVNAALPGTIALVAAIVSIAAQEALYHIARNAAKKMNSPVMMANAWDHRSDALSSIGSFIGIGAARLGLWFMDPAASLVICALILFSAYKIGKSSIEQLIDVSAPPEKLEKIRQAVLRVDGVRHIDQMRSRIYANKLYVDIEIAALRDMSFEQAHAICEHVHHAVEQSCPEVLHCTVHANPHNQDDTEVDPHP